MKEIQLDDTGKEQEVTVLVGVLPAVIINKLFGSIAACDIKVRIDLNTGDWVIERERYLNAFESEWLEIARQPMQPSADYIWDTLRGDEPNRRVET